MSKGTTSQQESGLPLETSETPQNQGTLPATGQEETQQQPPKEVPQDKKILTVEQYLRRAEKDQATADLIRTTHKTKTLCYADWEKETDTLLKKKVW